jgi:SAM-dependent methyltransferase
LAKTYRTIQQWDHWFFETWGKSILEAEQEVLQKLLSEFYGKHALLVGLPHQASLLHATNMYHHTVLSPIMKSAIQIESAFNELPIHSGSIDLVLLPHSLEYIDNQRQLLAEACRIIKPEGHIVIVGFNPFSLWGLKKSLKKSRAVPPTTGNFLNVSTLQQWLALADFELVQKTSILFAPPLYSSKRYKKGKVWEWIGSRFFSNCGGVYILIAKAKMIPLTPIRLKWQQQLGQVPAIRNI